MCLALPGKLVEINRHPEGGISGVVDYTGLKKTIDLGFVPEACLDQYVLVHAGFAISVLDEDEAQATLATFAQLDEQLNAQLDKPNAAE
ncbi:MAG: HypC/HybG/HupF family hydrogenase formation chaperone [Pseudomonadales bacterium]|nr:HypC/HybG/HupF family hydrogenase formation chaperone [Pseudomonadales bacterium]